MESRFDSNSASWEAHPGGGGYGLWALVGFEMLYLFLWTRRINWNDSRRATAFAHLYDEGEHLWDQRDPPPCERQRIARR